MRFANFAAILTLAVSPLAFAGVPTTQPGQSAEYMAGWNARINATAATIVGWNDADRAINAQPPADPPPVAGPKDLTDFLNKLTAPANLAKADYTVNGPVILNFSVKLNGSTISCPKGMTNFQFAKPGLTFDNFLMPTGGVAFEFGADNCTVSNFQIGVGSPDGSVVQGFKTIPGGTNAHVISGHMGKTVTCSAYFDRGGLKAGDPGVVVTSVAFDGVANGAEYPLRFDVPADGTDAKIVQTGATVKNCQIINQSTSKDTVGIREFKNITITGDVDPSGKLLATITGDIRLGQDPPTGFPPTTSVGQYCSGIVINQVAFTANQMPTCAVEGYEGVIASVTGCTFTGYTVPCVTGGLFSEFTLGGNSGPSAVKLWASSSKGHAIIQSTPAAH